MVGQAETPIQGCPSDQNARAPTVRALEHRLVAGSPGGEWRLGQGYSSGSPLGAGFCLPWGHSRACGLGLRTADQEYRPSKEPLAPSARQVVPTLGGSPHRQGRGQPGATVSGVILQRSHLWLRRPVWGEAEPGVQKLSSSCMGHTPAIAAVPAQIYLLLAHCVPHPHPRDVFTSNAAGKQQGLNLGLPHE